ncbi:hypothetical protein FQA39_LY01158 [Lamprigera yunnana]|nr:hypothetical protein FQA39_LY01158 [Lamprigera yunnana]
MNSFTVVCLTILINFGLSNQCKEPTFKNTLLKFSNDEVGDFSMSMRIYGCVTPEFISPKVTIIECYNEKIPILKDGAITNMLELTTLVFSDNNLFKIKRHAFMNLPRLEDIVLVDNEIRSIEVGVFSILPSVTRIRLKGNKLTYLEHDTIEYEWFDVNSKLSIFDISYNLLRRVPPNAFLHTKKLEIINLSYNQILTLAETAFNGLNTLYNLDLSNNRLYQLTGNVFLPIVALDDLRLNGNNLTYIHDQVLEDVNKNLSVITVYSNPWQCACYDNIFKWVAKRANLQVDVVIGCKLEFNPVCVIPLTKSQNCQEDTDDELDSMFYKQFNTTITCK